MNELQIFSNPQFGEIRTITENGKPLFCGSDIAKALGYKRPNEAVTARCKGTVKRRTPTKGGEQEMNFIPEGDIYRLAAKSELPGAEEFESWIFDEVLPSIRKHGAYMTPQKIEDLVQNPDLVIQLCEQLKAEQGARKMLQAENSALAVDKQIMQPKAEYFDELVDRNLLTNFRETAKQLGIKQRDFIDFLLEQKYIYRDQRGKIMPYAAKNKGLFEIKETANAKTKWSGTQTLITPKGRETFRLLYMHKIGNAENSAK